jgi:hypothetical protein
LTEPPERYFERREIHAALEFARAGGIAVHRNLDIYDGRISARGFVMRRPFLHVIARRPELEAWARRHRVPIAAIQPEKRRGVAHIDVFGELAEALMRRLRGREHLAARFREFTRAESALYSQLAAQIADDLFLLELSEQSAPGQPPPNMLFGAVHYLLLRGVWHPLARYFPTVAGDGAAPPGTAFPDFRDFCLKHASAIAELLANRRVQTNEVGRCAALLPALAYAGKLAGSPLALVEVGASAGLNLLVDRYCYEYGTQLLGDVASPVRIACEVRGELAPPLAIPAIAGRAGVDLAPVDVADPDQALWLRALVWPDQPHRHRLLLAAISVAREARPHLLAGDAADTLSAAGDAAGEGPLCVLSSFIEFQLGQAGRQRLDQAISEASRSRRVYRLRFEWEPGARPWLDLREYRDGEPGPSIRLASAHEHGRWLKWRDAASADNGST